MALASRHSINLVNMNFISEYGYSDGVHLNNTGYKEIAIRLADAIEVNRKY